MTDITPEGVEALERAAQEAERALDKARTMRDDEKRQLIHAFRERVEREVDLKHAEKIQALCNASVAASKAALAAKQSLALSGKTARVPLGTRMVEWELVRDYTTSKHKLRPSGRLGLVEVLTEGSPLPGNRAHGLPKIGDVIIRVLKKQGGKSLNCMKLDSWDAMNRWFPEGQDPPTKETVDGKTIY